MGRLWQTLILMRWNPVFAVLPVESLIRDHRSDYYAALAESNRTGESTGFIAFALRMIEAALAEQIETEQDAKYVTEQVERLLKVMGEKPRSARELMDERVFH